MAKFTTQDKVNILTLLLSGERKNELCRRYAIDKKELTMWKMRWLRYGLRGLKGCSHRHHPEDYKRRVVSDYLAGSLSKRQVAVDHDISLATLKNWVRRYREA